MDCKKAQNLPHPIPLRCLVCTWDKSCALPATGQYTSCETRAWRKKKKEVTMIKKHHIRCVHCTWIWRNLTCITCTHYIRGHYLHTLYLHVHYSVGKKVQPDKQHHWLCKSSLMLIIMWLRPKYFILLYNTLAYLNQWYQLQNERNPSWAICFFSLVTLLCYQLCEPFDLNLRVRTKISLQEENLYWLTLKNHPKSNTNSTILLQRQRIFMQSLFMQAQWADLACQQCDQTFGFKIIVGKMPCALWRKVISFAKWFSFRMMYLLTRKYTDNFTSSVTI